MPTSKVQASILSDYKSSDLDTGGATEYFGFTKMDGEWYILELTTSTLRYDSGDSAYTTAWTNRASGTYDYFDVEFG